MEESNILQVIQTLIQSQESLRKYVKITGENAEILWLYYESYNSYLFYQPPKNVLILINVHNISRDEFKQKVDELTSMVLKYKNNINVMIIIMPDDGLEVKLFNKIISPHTNILHFSLPVMKKESIITSIKETFRYW